MGVDRFQLMRERLNWTQQGQTALAETIANADTLRLLTSASSGERAIGGNGGSLETERTIGHRVPRWDCFIIWLARRVAQRSWAIAHVGAAMRICHAVGKSRASADFQRLFLDTPDPQLRNERVDRRSRWPGMFCTYATEPALNIISAKGMGAGDRGGFVPIAAA